MSETLQWLDRESLTFPPLTRALKEPNGLLAIGGDLTANRLISAYKNGIFPWYNEGEPVLWWSPDPRTIIATDAIRINRSLKKFLKRLPYTITINNAFDEVIELCADAPFRKEGTWIVDEMVDAYQELHQLGYAHSVEVWYQGKLVGGLYGVAVGGYFSGESMFYTMDNASKVALLALGQKLQQLQIPFIDCQLTNPFLEDMGSVEISRKKFIEQQEFAQTISIPNDFWQPSTVVLSIL